MTTKARKNRRDRQLTLRFTTRGGPREGAGRKKGEGVFKSLLAVRNVLLYVLKNARRHLVPHPGVHDPFSSASWFEQWKEEIEVDPVHFLWRPVARARSWILRQGWWERHGPLSIGELPAAARP